MMEKISIQELRNGLKATVLNFTNQEVDVIFAVASIDGDGEISSAEFQHLLGTGVSFERMKDEKAAFLGLTRIMMVALTVQLRSMLASTGKTPTDNEMESLFKKGDLDGNGKTTEKVVHVQA